MTPTENSLLKTIITFSSGFTTCLGIIVFLYNYELIPYTNKSKLIEKEAFIHTKEEEINRLNLDLRILNQSVEINKEINKKKVTEESTKHKNGLIQTNQKGDNIGGNKKTINNN